MVLIPRGLNGLGAIIAGEEGAEKAKGAVIIKSGGNDRDGNWWEEACDNYVLIYHSYLAWLQWVVI